MSEFTDHDHWRASSRRRRRHRDPFARGGFLSVLGVASSAGLERFARWAGVKSFDVHSDEDLERILDAANRRQP